MISAVLQQCTLVGHVPVKEIQARSELKRCHYKGKESQGYRTNTFKIQKLHSVETMASSNKQFYFEAPAKV